MDSALIKDCNTPLMGDGKTACSGITPLATTWCDQCGNRPAHTAGLCLPCLHEAKEENKVSQTATKQGAASSAATDKETCKVPGCKRKAAGRGFCNTHWQHWRKGNIWSDGTPVAPEDRDKALEMSAEAVKKGSPTRKYVPPTEAKACNDCGKPALTRKGKPSRHPYCADCFSARTSKRKTAYAAMDERCAAERTAREADMHSHAQHGNEGAASSAATDREGAASSAATPEIAALREKANRGFIPDLMEVNLDEESLPEDVEYLGVPMHGHPEYYKIIGKMAEIHGAKNRDYGAGDPLGNFKESAKLGIDPFRGALIRLGDKYARTMSLARPGAQAQVKEESIIDTLIDLANYSILSIILYLEGQSGDGTEVN